MPPGPQPGTGEGMSAASGIAPHREDPEQWDGLRQPDSHPSGPRLPFPATTSSGSRAGHLKDASGAATRPGSRPVLDQPGPLATNWAAIGNQDSPVTLARPLP